MTRKAAGVLAAVLAALVVAPVPAAAAPGCLLFHVDDPRITEASGLAAGIAGPGVLYVHNDSGDTNRFFALDARTGATVATITVPGARNIDWEDIAVARDRTGTPSVWLADTGDNDGVRDEIQVYRVDEPTFVASTRGAGATSHRPDVWRLRYPDGAHDAESLAVSPGGAAYLVTKSITGGSQVYRLPASPAAGRVQVLRKIGAIALRLTGTPGPFAPVGQLTATSAAFSSDGSVLAVRTYTDAYLWRIVGGAVASALTRAPTRVALPQQQQGEGITVAGGRLLLDSEGTHSPVYEVPIPALPAVSGVPAVPAGASAATVPAEPGTSAAGTRTGQPRSPGPGRTLVLGVAGGLILITGLGLVLQRGRRRSR